MSSADLANLLLGLMAIVAVTATLAGMACLFWVTRERRPVAGYTPPVTIFKPLKGLDEELEANLRSFFRLDYPCFQLLFCVADADDPAIEMVQRLKREFPGQDAQLVVGCPAFGLNPKVESLAAMEPHRKHDVILISDSNVRARPSYLRETVCYLSAPKVGLVSNLFAGVGEVYPSAIMENLQLNGFIAAGVASAAVFRATCVVGKSMLMPVRALEAIGGFAAVRNVLAEDQVIGIRLRQAGYSIRLSHHVLQNVNSRRSLRWFLNRHSRWYKIRRRVAPAAFLAEPTANLATVGLVWAFSGDSGIAWGGLLLLVSLGLIRDAVQSRRLRGSFPKPRDLLFSPVKDILLLPVWFDAIVNRRVLWRGNRFLIGRMTRLRRAQVSGKPRRRLRGKRRLPPRNPDMRDQSID
jgi:ceramide glucosyltransferase